MVTFLLIVVGSLVAVGFIFVVLNGGNRPRKHQSSEAKVENQHLSGAQDESVRASGID